VVDYYRCEVCKQVWSHRKDDPNAPVKLVTTPPTKK
jgi:hypothetical protein